MEPHWRLGYYYISSCPFISFRHDPALRLAGGISIGLGLTASLAVTIAFQYRGI
jgi:hypothetical protein